MIYTHQMPILAIAGLGFLAGAVVAGSAAWYVQALRIDRMRAAHQEQIAATEKAIADAKAQVASRSTEVITKYVAVRQESREAASSAKQEIENALPVVDAMSDPRCALPERVRYAINAAREQASADGAGDAEGAMRETGTARYRDGRGTSLRGR